MSTIIKLNKNGLSTIVETEIALENAFDLTISQYEDSNAKAASFTLPFQISVARNHAPHIESEIVIVIREKVDLTALGPNDVLIKNIGEDLGGKNYINSKPYRPKDLPPGFQELIRT